MPEPKPQIAEFRDVVERVVDNQVRTARLRRSSWPDYDKVAHVGGLTFSRLEGKDGGLGMDPQLRERRWGIATNLKLDQYSGNIALISTVSRPDQMLRVLNFLSPLQINIRTKNLLTEDDELDAAVAWARSPHLEGASLRQLAVLTADEQVAVDEEMHSHSQKAAQTARDIDTMRGGGIRPSPFSNERIT